MCQNVFTCADAADHGSRKRCLGLFVDHRQKAEQKTVAGHGVQYSRYREQTTYQTSNDDVKKRKNLKNRARYAAECILNGEPRLRRKQGEHRAARDQVLEHGHSQVVVDDRQRCVLILKNEHVRVNFRESNGVSGGQLRTHLIVVRPHQRQHRSHAGVR